MSFKVDISFNGLLSSLSERKKKNILRLQKSVHSLNAEYADYNVNLKTFKFSQKEIDSAIQRLEKDEVRYPCLELCLDKHVKRPSHFDKIYGNDNESFIVDLFKAIFGFIIPGVGYDNRYVRCEKTKIDWADFYRAEDLRAEVLKELYYRRMVKILSNVLSKFFEFRNLITAESPIKIIKYKYFDLIFSLKKGVVLNSMLTIECFNQPFYLREHEKKYYRYLQAAGRA